MVEGLAVTRPSAILSPARRRRSAGDPHRHCEWPSSGAARSPRSFICRPLRGTARLLKQVVLVDPDVSRARALAATLSGARVAESYEHVWDDIDAAIIATPPWLHHRIAMPLLARGIHVLCEKPLAESAADARAMIEQAEQLGRASVRQPHPSRFPGAETREGAARFRSHWRVHRRSSTSRVPASVGRAPQAGILRRRMETRACSSIRARMSSTPSAGGWATSRRW